ncbi:hypothetical protein F5X68DRAFT_278823 [Plectosphaerella plurivora]|uniref:Glycosyl transferase CAP10 domain-containing protein n=1 Tax=Plectosphaerella plurivora TaxID=936078 RepID=A0A9P8V3M6_9PEZI|nr:hypothetical protein F5X68DRAFT_278823 [Plectosphaerella plurivora]
MVKLAPRRPSSLLRYTVGAGLIITIFYYLSYSSNGFAPRYLVETTPQSSPKAPPAREQTPIKATDRVHDGPSESKPQAPLSGAGSSDRHPIDELIETADDTFDKLMKKQSKTVEAAAEEYRLRRGRHPPPGFDTWFTFAKERNAVIVEEFFDQIYHDLEPFWALQPGQLRREAAAYEMFITVRNGYANCTSDWFWTTIWLDLIQTIDHLLPDMDIALNPMDEPRIIAPYEDISQYVEQARKTKYLAKPEDVSSEYQKLPAKNMVETSLKVQKKTWYKKGRYWDLARRGCAPDSPARTAPLQESFNGPPTFSTENAEPHMHRGYVANSTMARDICHQPDLQGFNGIFIEPLSISTTPTLFPMFGGSKLSINNEILLPAPMYWKEDERFTGGDDHGGAWATKVAGVIWRGVATGGRNRVNNWKGFQRHRFVTMSNESEVYAAEHNLWPPINFSMPGAAYNILAHAAGKMNEWLRSWANVAFTDLMCEPNEDEGKCWYTGPYYTIAPGLTMAQQFMFKYLPDIDGNSFSGRYLGFLRSTSVPIKATVWREWHDSRLLPWKHYVPMDTRFIDYYGIMQYFLGYPAAGLPGHDEQAERIATAGKEWAEKALRREDMQIYTLRLLLEYARVTDERREKMGWVNDLLETKKAESKAEGSK